MMKSAISLVLANFAMANYGYPPAQYFSAPHQPSQQYYGYQTGEGYASGGSSDDQSRYSSRFSYNQGSGQQYKQPLSNRPPSFQQPPSYSNFNQPPYQHQTPRWTRHTSTPWNQYPVAMNQTEDGTMPNPQYPGATNPGVMNPGTIPNSQYPGAMNQTDDGTMPNAQNRAAMNYGNVPNPNYTGSVAGTLNDYKAPPPLLANNSTVSDYSPSVPAPVLIPDVPVAIAPEPQATYPTRRRH